MGIFKPRDYYVVGELVSSSSLASNTWGFWNLVGVFDAEKLAVSACINSRRFYVRVGMNIMEFDFSNHRLVFPMAKHDPTE